MATITIIGKKSAGTQATGTIRVRERTGAQFRVQPIISNGLNTSFYAPIVTDIDRGTPQFAVQWRFAKGVGFNTEVRWRPF
jgi:hypothetical protein